jgi:hypothetical protein
MDQTSSVTLLIIMTYLNEYELTRFSFVARKYQVSIGPAGCMSRLCINLLPCSCCRVYQKMIYWYDVLVIHDTR